MDAPAVAVSNDGKTIAVAWMDMRAGSRDVHWTVGVGGKFGPETAVNADPANAQGHPSLAFDAKGVAWCAWEDARNGPNDPRIYAADWTSKKNVPVSERAEGKCGYPSLAASGATLGVAYESAAGVSFRSVP